MSSSVAISLPVDTSALTSAKAKAKELRDELKKANDEVKKTKASGNEVTRNQINRVQQASENVDAFKRETRETKQRQQEYSRNLRFAAHEQSRNFDRVQRRGQFDAEQGLHADIAAMQQDARERVQAAQQARKSEWSDALSSGNQAWNNSWDKAIAAGKPIWDRAHPAARSTHSLIQGRLNEPRGDMFDAVQQSAMAIHTVRHVARLAGHISESFYRDHQLDDFAEKSVQSARKTSGEYVGDRLSAVGHAAFLVPDPTGATKIAGAALYSAGKALNYGGESERANHDYLIGLRRSKQSYQQGVYKGPDDAAWNGLGSAVSRAQVIASAEKDILSDSIGARAAKGFDDARNSIRNFLGMGDSSKSVFRNIYGADKLARATQMEGAASEKKARGYAALERMDFETAQHYFSKANEIVKGSFTGHTDMWSLSDLYMQRLSASESNRSFMHGQMKIAANRSGD